jgi:hypothetical protein
VSWGDRPAGAEWGDGVRSELGEFVPPFTKLIECEGLLQTQSYAYRGDACPQLKPSDLQVPGSYDRHET